MLKYTLMGAHAQVLEMNRLVRGDYRSERLLKQQWSFVVEEVNELRDALLACVSYRIDADKALQQVADALGDIFVTASYFAHLHNINFVALADDYFKRGKRPLRESLYIKEAKVDELPTPEQTKGFLLDLFALLEDFDGFFFIEYDMVASVLEEIMISNFTKFSHMNEDLNQVIEEQNFIAHQLRQKGVAEEDINIELLEKDGCLIYFNRTRADGDCPLQELKFLKPKSFVAPDLNWLSQLAVQRKDGLKEWLGETYDALLIENAS